MHLLKKFPGGLKVKTLHLRANFLRAYLLMSREKFARQKGSQINSHHFLNLRKGFFQCGFNPVF